MVKGDDVFSSFGTLLNARILTGGATASLPFLFIFFLSFLFRCSVRWGKFGTCTSDVG